MLLMSGMMAQLLFFYQLTLGVKETSENGTLGVQQLIMLELGINSFSTIVALYILNLKTYYTTVVHLIFTIGTFCFASHISESKLVVDAYKSLQVAWFLAF